MAYFMPGLMMAAVMYVTQGKKAAGGNKQSTIAVEATLMHDSSLPTPARATAVSSIGTSFTVCIGTSFTVLEFWIASRSKASQGFLFPPSEYFGMICLA